MPPPDPSMRALGITCLIVLIGLLAVAGCIGLTALAIQVLLVAP